jgi:5-methylcytosine-specific restriction endonuclease McrA
MRWCIKKQTNFYTWLRSGLRKLSRRWPPIFEALAAAKVPYIGDNKRRKFSYICAECTGEFDAKSVSVDHITPAGQLNNKEDIADFVEKLFCDASGLQVLCDECHNIKTYMERYNVSKKEAIVSIWVAQTMKDKKTTLALLQENGYNNATNDEKRKSALREIFLKENQID